MSIRLAGLLLVLGCIVGCSDPAGPTAPTAKSLRIELDLEHATYTNTQLLAFATMQDASEHDVTRIDG